MPATKAGNDEPKDSVEGYAGKPASKPMKRPEDASEDAELSEAGVTEPTQVFGGDGVTPFAKWDESQADRRKKQAELDEKNRERAVEAAGLVQTTGKK